MRYLTAKPALLALTLVLVVTAAFRISIAGEKDTQASNNDNASLSQPQPPIRVACIGDSITFGAGIEDREHDSYPAALQRLLGDGYEVRNFGRSGADVLLANNGPYARTTQHKQALAFRPNIVICNLGINDHALVEANQEKFAQDYTNLLKQYSDLPTKPQLFLWTHLAPVMPGQRNYERCHQLQDTYQQLLQQVASGTAAIGIDMHTPLAGHAEWFPDHLHPNAQGARVIAQTTADAIAAHAAQSTNTSPAEEMTSDMGFEGAPLGECQRWTTPAGIWSAEAANAEFIAEHVRTGERSLRILGGQNRSLQLEVTRQTKTQQILSFWAERWTARYPFRFRIEQHVQGEWVEVYSGDNSIRVGGFHTQVHVPLRLADKIVIRVQLTTPDSTGLLIDDVELVDAKPMQATALVVEQPTLPALCRAEWSPITRIRVDVDGQLGTAPVLTSLQVTTDGTTELSDIAKVRLFYTGNQPLVTASANGNAFATATPFGAEQSPGETLTIQGSQPLSSGANYFWIAYQLQDHANIDHRVNSVVTQAQLADGSSLTPHTPTPLAGQRMGVAVRLQGDDGVHTYRIPGLATTNKGTLIGVYDIRHRNGRDLPGDIDIGMSRSTDGGSTWEPMQVIMDRGADRKWSYDGVGDPAVLVDRTTNTIWVAALWSHGNRGWNGSQPGLEPEQTGQLLLVRSDDDGRTWSEPINITKQVKLPEWCLLLQGPGKGITMQDGTLVFAAQFQDTNANRRLPRSTIIYSRDHGATWHIGTGAFDDTTEAQVVEIEPGVLMLNCRYNREPRRVVALSTDLGTTWREHPSSRQALIEPRACMASLLQANSLGPDSADGWLFFSNPNNLSSRRQMTIKASNDRGVTWKTAHQVLLDEAPSAGYSCLSMIDSNTLGILYEGSQAHMTFQRVKPDEFLPPESPASPPTKP